MIFPAVPRDHGRQQDPLPGGEPNSSLSRRTDDLSHGGECFFTCDGKEKKFQDFFIALGKKILRIIRIFLRFSQPETPLFPFQQKTQILRMRFCNNAVRISAREMAVIENQRLHSELFRQPQHEVERIPPVRPQIAGKGTGFEDKSPQSGFVHGAYLFFQNRKRFAVKPEQRQNLRKFRHVCLPSAEGDASDIRRNGSFPGLRHFAETVAEFE